MTTKKAKDTKVKKTLSTKSKTSKLSTSKKKTKATTLKTTKSKTSSRTKPQGRSTKYTRILKSNSSILETIKKDISELKSLERAASNNFEKSFILEAGSKKSKYKNTKSLLTAIWPAILNQATKPKKGKNKLSPKEVFMFLEDHDSLEDSFWTSLAQKLSENNIEITELNAEEEEAHLECQDENITAFKFYHSSSTKDKMSDSSKSFLSTLCFSKMLTADEERKIAQLMSNENTKVFAKKQLMTSNLRLVISVAKKYLNSGFNLSDLIQEGVFGLNKAIDKFDYKFGNKFSTYATWWIRQAITRSISDQSKIIRIPVHMMEVINKLVRVEKELILKNGNIPSLEELSSEMQKYGTQFTPQKISEIKKINIDLVSLDKPISSNENSNFSDFVREDGENSNPELLASRNLLREGLEALIDSKKVLQKHEAKIISLLYGIYSDGKKTTQEKEKNKKTHSYEEIAKMFEEERPRKTLLIPQAQKFFLEKLSRGSKKYLKDRAGDKLNSSAITPSSTKEVVEWIKDVEANAIKKLKKEVKNGKLYNTFISLYSNPSI